MSVLYTIEAVTKALNDERLSVSMTSTGGIHVRWKDIKNIPNDFEKVAVLIDKVRELQAAGYNIGTVGDQSACNFRATSKNTQTGVWAFYPHFFVQPPGTARAQAGAPASNAADAVRSMVSGGFTPEQIAMVLSAMSGGSTPPPPTPGPTPTTETTTTEDVIEDDIIPV